MFPVSHSQNHGSVLGQETPSIFSQRLGVALNRALERRLGKAPSPTAVSKATEATYGTKGLAFVRHAVRVQEQLANLHEQLQRDQEQHGHATGPPKDSSVPLMGPRKRSVEHDDEPSNPLRETKRIRVEGRGLRRHMPSPVSDNGVKPGPQAPGDPLSPKEVPIAPRKVSDAKSAELPRADYAKTQGTDNNLPSRLPILDVVPPNPSDNTDLDSNRQSGTAHHSPLNDTTDDGNHEQVAFQAPRRDEPAPSDPAASRAHTQNKLDKAPSLSIPDSIPGAQGPPLSP